MFQPMRRKKAEGTFDMGIGIMRLLFADIAAIDPAETIAGADEDAIAE